MENKVEIRVLDAEFDEVETDDMGMSMVSFVNKPAIRRNFFALSELADSLEVKFSSIDEYKMQVTGAVLVPDEKILRMSETGDAYFIRFSKEVIEKIRNNFMKKKITDQTNLEHDQEIKLSGNYVIESYVISTDLQNTKLGLPIGAWVLTYQITDKTFFQEKILTKEVQGFSLEGTFTFTDKKMNEDLSEKLEEKKPKSELQLLKEALYLS